MKKVYFITSNKGKILEVRTKLLKLNVKVIQKNLGYPELQSDTLEEVVLFGIDHLKKKFEKSFLIEDSGLFIYALDGFPGVYSSYVFNKIGCLGILKLIEDKYDKERKATFRSVCAYCEPKKEPVLFLGESKGKISKRIIGIHGFGYDPIFIPYGEKKTFGEMKIEEKNYYSHRSKSIDKFIDYFVKLL